MPSTAWRTRVARILDELKRRKVPQAAAGYAVVAWLLLQIGEVTFEPLGIPSWGMRLLIAAVVALFPVVLAVSWFFELTWKGFIKDTTQAQGRDSAPPAHGELVASGPVAASIAVLPFDDMSPGRDQEYFCHGIAEEILNQLARISNLHVASRSSSFRAHSVSTSVTGIGKELGVATVLEGSVRKSDNHLRVTTELIDVRDGFQLWSSTYDRDLMDIFEIQADIAAEVANALEVELTTRGTDECFTTANARAYEHYLKGQYYFRRWGTRNMAFAIQMFTKAVEIDPGYARAWSSLAESYAMTCMYWNATEDYIASADRASLRALTLLPGLAESHVARGLSHVIRGEEAAAIAEFETAQRLDPSLFDAWYFYGRVCFQRGELQRAAGLFEQAERLDPEDFQAPILLRQIYRSLGRSEESRAAARRGVDLAMQHLELNPDDTRAMNLALGGLSELGMVEDLKQLATRTLEIDGHNPDTLYNVACGYAQIGELDSALECLEHASMRGMAIAGWAENDSDLEPLRQLPRFRALISRLRREEVRRK